MEVRNPSKEECEVIDQYCNGDCVDNIAVFYGTGIEFHILSSMPSSSKLISFDFDCEFGYEKNYYQYMNRIKGNIEEEYWDKEDPQDNFENIPDTLFFDVVIIDQDCEEALDFAKQIFPRIKNGGHLMFMQSKQEHSAKIISEIFDVFDDVANVLYYLNNTDISVIEKR